MLYTKSASKRYRILGVLALPFLLAACVSEAPEPQNQRNMRSESYMVAGVEEDGALAFRRYCAACHGEDGKGEGQASDALTVPAPNLTVLRMNHNGEFPVDFVSEKIDGRQEVLGHNRTREMPIWANIWIDEFSDAESEEGIGSRIQRISDYIETLQVEE